MDWAISDVKRILTQMPGNAILYIDKDVLLDATQFTKIFNNGNIQRCQIDLLAIIFKSVIDPRSLDYVKIESIINQLAIGFTYLWGLGYKNLALLLTSQVDHSTTDTLTINITVNRSRISKEIKDELDILFPYKRVINETTSVNLIEETVTDLANEMFNMRWIPAAYDNYIIDTLGEKNIQKILPADLKVQLSEFIITHERLQYV